MTRLIRLRFRKLVLVAAIGAGALGLAIGTASTALAGETPTPVTTGHHCHHKPKPQPVVVRTECFPSLEIEKDTVPVPGYQGGSPVVDAYSAGQPTDPPQGGDHQVKTVKVEVVQLTEVCVSSNGKVTVKDLTGPFAWEVPPSGPAPTPTGLPSSIYGMLTQ